MGPISSWTELTDIESEFASSKMEWVFRGQSQDWPLQSSLDRVRDDFQVAADRITRLEKQFITDFKRLYPKYAPGACPELDNSQLWLSLMRHHGAPTRLLDFTFSFFIATYFALEEARAQSIVWAINKTWLTKFGQTVFRRLGGRRLQVAWGNRDGWAFDKIFWKQRRPMRFVYPTNPFRLHERSAEQQALFLCPGDVTVNFQENLESMKGSRSKENVRKVFIEGGETRMKLLLRLYKAGINRAGLFPGLDGFAQSLRSKTVLFLELLDKEKAGTRIRPPFNLP